MASVIFRHIRYYSLAVLVGCFFATLTWLAPRLSCSFDFHGNARSPFLTCCEAGLLLGFPTTLIYAFLLQWLTARLRWKGIWSWTAAGTVMGCGLIWGLNVVGWLWMCHSAASLRFLTPLRWLIVGPMILTAPTWWLVRVAAATAATACILYWVRPGRLKASETSL